MRVPISLDEVAVDTITSLYKYGPNGGSAASCTVTGPQP